MTDVDVNNKKIAKNTVLLYIRTLLIMVVSLYSSRIVLNTLGVEDYGIYQAVGGVVAMFSVLSGALSNSISRFITFSLGKGYKDELNVVFCTSVNIQVFIGIVVLILCEILGVWFLNHKMHIPSERLFAANWVLQCSLITFIVGLISTPYNACIIAHERMNAFAAISIIEAVLKLVVIYLLCVSPFDKLITYCCLLVAVSIIVRLIYGWYCRHRFEECKYHFIYDSRIFKHMIGFAGWNFFSNAAYVFNTQGVSILVNMYFGVALNAARGIATQVDAAVMQFVNNFSMALNPQITKSYASNDTDRMNSLICKGARFSFFLLMFFCVPIILETEYILGVWLKTVPEYTSSFVRLSLVGSLITCLGTTGYTACMATGNIRKYVLWITLSGSTVFFITWLAYYMGASVLASYIIYIVVYIIVQVIRLVIMKQILNFSPTLWIKDVLCRITLPFILSLIVPYFVIKLMPPTFIRFLVTGGISVIVSCVSVYYLGLTRGEKRIVLDKIINLSHKRDVTPK